MNLAAQKVAQYLDKKGIRYKLDGEQKEILRLGFPGKVVGALKYRCIFGEGNETVSILIYDLAFSEENTGKMYRLCSQLNGQYRFARFYVDESSHSITIQADAFLNMETCGEEVYKLIVILEEIGNEAAAEIMKIGFPDMAKTIDQMM